MFRNLEHNQTDHVPKDKSANSQPHMALKLVTSISGPFTIHVRDSGLREQNSYMLLMFLLETGSGLSYHT